MGRLATTRVPTIIKTCEEWDQTAKKIKVVLELQGLDKTQI